MRKGFIELGVILGVVAIVAVAALTGGVVAMRQTVEKERIFKEGLEAGIQAGPISGNVGAVYYVSAKTTRLSGSGVSASDTSVSLVELVTPAGTPVTMTNFGDVGYGTIEPGRTNKEFISFTGITQNGDGTATLTGVSRGLNFVYPYTASTTLAKSHPGSSPFVISNPPQLYDLSISKFNDAFVTSTLTFSNVAIPRLNAQHTYASGDELKFVTYGQLASTSFSGTVDASLSQKGIVEIATRDQLVVGSATGTDSTALLVPPSSYFTATSSATTSLPVANYLESGLYKISPTWIATSSNYSWGGDHTFNGAFTSNGTTTLANTTITNVTITGTTTVTGSVVGGTKFGGTGADGALALTSGTTTINLGGSSLVEKNYSSISITGTGALAFSSPAAGGTIVVLKSRGACTLTSTASPAIDLRNLGGVGGNGGVWVGSTNGSPGGGGGSSASLDGQAGLSSAAVGSSGPAGTAGTGYGRWGFGGSSSSTGGRFGGVGANPQDGGAAGSSTLFVSSYAKYAKVYVTPGSGGGGGGAAGSTGTGSGGAGGRGAGALYMECDGALTSSSTINAAGTAGSNGGNEPSDIGGAGGGGGGGGSIVILARSIASDTGTYTVSGGAGGLHGSSTFDNSGDGGAGANGYAVRATNTEW